jgi:hypothetical protein
MQEGLNQEQVTELTWTHFPNLEPGNVSLTDLDNESALMIDYKRRRMLRIGSLGDIQLAFSRTSNLVCELVDDEFARLCIIKPDCGSTACSSARFIDLDTQLWNPKAQCLGHVSK